MKYINKDTHLQKGHDITDHYLESTCKVDDGDGNYRYQNVDYDGTFGSTGAKASMLHLALDNQGSFCCYCMRDLHQQNQDVNLEHIIPQSIDATRFHNYIDWNVPHLTVSDIVRDGDFTGVQNVGIPPRPHTVTFENLVASCDGTFPDKLGSSQCCNHKRGDKTVFPMFYVVGIENEITYMEDGSMQPSCQCKYQTEYRKTIDNARLNCTNLQDIRRLWHLFSSEQRVILTSCSNDKNKRMILLRQVLYHDIALTVQDARIETKFMKDAYWETFLMYHWFHQKI